MTLMRVFLLSMAVGTASFFAPLRIGSSTTGALKMAISTPSSPSTPATPGDDPFKGAKDALAKVQHAQARASELATQHDVAGKLQAAAASLKAGAEAAVSTANRLEAEHGITGKAAEAARQAASAASAAAAAAYSQLKETEHGTKLKDVEAKMAMARKELDEASAKVHAVVEQHDLKSKVKSVGQSTVSVLESAAAAAKKAVEQS